MQLIIPFLALNLLLLVSGLAPSHESNVVYEDGTYDTHVASHENGYVGGRFGRSTFESLLPPGLDGIHHLLQLICSHTAFPGTCIQELSSFKISDLSALNPLDLVSFSVRAATNRANEALNLASRFATGSGSSSSSSIEDQCASDCVSLISDAKDELSAAESKLSAMRTSSPSSLRDVKVWMSAALSYQEACADGFDLVTGGSSARYEIQSNLEYLSEVIGNGYTLVDTLAQVGGDLGTWISGNLPPIPPPYVHLRRRRRSLLSSSSSSSFPRWVGAAERKLLQANSSSSAMMPSPDAIVAADGTGDYLNITSALQAIPPGDRGGARYVIYIKAGVYEEVFNISKDLTKLTFIGDGIGNTVITGSRNVASGLYNTYRTSTVGISGSGFLARDLTFRNTAGPGGHQAVALRAGADFLVFYRCGFEGYQDTLYALSSRQFYRECRIAGTVDFIFGNAIAIFQNCELVARQPGDGQQNTYTAQGRKLAADVSGFSFQNCTVGAEALPGGVSARTFLGRPWKAYSRVIFMQSEIGAVVDPAGWLQWNQSDPFIDTLFYGEYQNRGPGAATGGRVAWPGVHPNLTQDEADTFTVSNFIAGDEWLSPLQVQYHNSLF